QPIENAANFHRRLCDRMKATRRREPSGYGYVNRFTPGGLQIATLQRRLREDFLQPQFSHVQQSADFPALILGDLSQFFEKLGKFSLPPQKTNPGLVESPRVLF